MRGTDVHRADRAATAMTRTGVTNVVTRTGVTNVVTRTGVTNVVTTSRRPGARDQEPTQP